MLDQLDRLDQVITSEVIEKYQETGAVVLRQVLDESWLSLAEQGVNHQMRNPGPGATHLYKGEPGEYFSDYCNYQNNPSYIALLKGSPIADIVARIVGSQNLWLYFDQIFIKEGGYSRRTCWHQDTPYFMAEGKQIASVWFSLDPLTEEETLEVVAGSHKGPIYDGAAFDPADDTAPFYGTGDFPRLPDIEAERDKWPIFRWSSSPGDVLIIHPSVLHGGGAMREGGRRRTISMRLFGDDVVYAERPQQVTPPFPGLAEALRPGDPLRHSYFPQIRPRD